MKHNTWIKKWWALALAFCLMLHITATTALATESSNDTTADVETEADAETAAEADMETPAIPEDAIYLSTSEDILYLAAHCVSDAWSRDKVFVLENDIALDGVDFEGIPSFGGTFLGQGFTISGYHLTQQQNAVGFFRYLQKTAAVEDLHLAGTIQPAKTGHLDIGGIAGVNRGTIRGCSFQGTVSGTERIGGIAGQNKVSGVIEDCTVSGIIYGDHYIGGIAGENLGVIRHCTNQAEVNAHVDHNSVSMSSSFGTSLDNLTVKESSTDATNIGGIAGISSGVIRSCENHALVGYEKMGYNVGGIAGSQIGYITECTNYGTIHGSDGVGGIVGQFKPNVVLNMGENHMSTMMEQMIDMMNSMSGMMGSMNGMMGSMSFEKQNMEDSMEILKKLENIEDLEDLKNLEDLEGMEGLDEDSINAAINELSSSFNSMYNKMMASGSKMTGQMSDMMASMGEMVETMEKLNEGLNIKIIDISKEDTPEDTVAKISHCANHAPVHGETYTGGIVGIADVEDTTAQDDTSGQLSMSTEGEVIMRLVIRDCHNAGTISANKQYAGGIVGNMTIGAIFHGMNTGSLDALNADYVGGIAGYSETYIVDSYNRSILAGNQYVGGIAGFGTEVVGCYTVAEIAAATKFAGGILGSTEFLPDEEAGLLWENHYFLTGKNLGGIDGVCYEGATAPMTIEEFLAAETLDECFRTVTVRFMAEGSEDVILTVDLGQTLAVAKIPQLEVDEHELYHWILQNSVTDQTLGMGETAQVQYVSKELLTDILFDQTYQAVFDAKNTVITSAEKTDSGRNLALAVGTFNQGTTLHLEDITTQVPVVNGVTVEETWQVTITDIGAQKLHYRIPDDLDPERLDLYVKDVSDNWEQRSFTVEGSYMIFDFTHGESAFALEVLPEEDLPVTAIGVAAGSVILLLITGRVIKKHNAKKKGTVDETN